MTALVTTFNDVLALLTFELTEDAKDDPGTTSAAYTLSNQKSFIFPDAEALQFRAVPGFLALNAQLFG